MKEFSILFCGAFAPDCPENENAATSRAAVIFQENLVEEMMRAGVGLTRVWSYFPVPSFPKVPRIFRWGGQDKLACGTEVSYLPFINLGPLKTVTLGVSAFFATVFWALSQPPSKAKVVVSYNLNAPPSGPIIAACRLCRCHFLPFVGDIYVPGEVVSDSLLNKLQFASQTRTAKNLSAVIAANQAIVDDFCPKADFVLVEGGVTNEFVDSFASLPIKRSTTTIAFAGQLSTLNGIPLLIEAMKLIEYPSIRLVIAGRGEHETLAAHAAQLDSRITYLGHIPHHEVMRLYEDADILVSLRRTDNQTNRYVFPSKTIECLATGRPLVTTCTGQMQLEFGDLVRTVRNEIPEEVANAILEIAQWSNEQRVEQHHRARQYVIEHRTWQANVSRIKGLINRIAA